MNNGIRIPERRCPYCDYKITGASDTTGKASVPRPSDYSICINCVEVSMFTEEGLRIPTDEEAKVATNDQGLLNAQRKLRLLGRGRPR